MRVPAQPLVDTPWAPSQDAVERPVIPVELRVDDRVTRAAALVDSGAVHNIASLDHAFDLGINVEVWPEATISIGGREQAGRFGWLDIALVDERGRAVESFELWTCFVSPATFPGPFDLVLGVGYAGSDSFFRRYRILLDYSIGEVTLRQANQ